MKKRKCGTIVAGKDSVLGNPLLDDFYEDDILMVSDGVISEISINLIHETLGVSLQSIINQKKHDPMK